MIKKKAASRIRLLFMILSYVFTTSNLRILKPNSRITCER